MLSPDLFKFDALSNFVGLFVGIFSLLIIVYSWGFMRRRRGLVGYYSCVILTLLVSAAAVFSNNLLLFMVFWGVLGLLLYLLVGFGRKERTPATAKKTFIIVGGADALMILGLALVWRIAGTVQMDKLSIALSSAPAVWAYLCLAAGAFAKAGVMPLHTWIPDAAEDAPTPVTAYLPASLDKLLGIYFLARLSLHLFKMTAAMNTVLMAVGSFTIMAAVMMALVQHDLKRLLGYHAVSQVGYMVLGIGTGNPLGIAGGLFHMLNNSIYKSCLFLSGGAVEKKTGTTELTNLGGLARAMPITFVAFLIAAFAISGVPPLNGFASKWMIYQGVIEAGKEGYRLWPLWLLAAIFGSALTLASFMKAVHAVFLGQTSGGTDDSKYKGGRTGPAIWLPQVFLAALCVIFGVFAYQVPLKLFIFPSVDAPVTFLGIWNVNAATALILIGIALGFIIYLTGTIRKVRETEIFVGGEILKDYPRMRVSGTEFYNTIADLGILRCIYRLAEKRIFDIYNIGAGIILGLSKVLRFIHSGVLPLYLSWCLLGIIIILLVLLR